MGELKLEMHPHAAQIYTLQTRQETSARGEEASSSYLASRDTQPSDPNSRAAQQVRGMNREMDQWTQAAAPNIFAEGET